MSKSIGNLITIKEALEKYSADALRIFVLGSHYRSPLTYSELTLEAAESGADRLRQAVQVEGGEKGDEKLDAEPYRQRFIEAMDDDFNTAQAMAALFDLARDINRASDEDYSVVAAQQALKELSGVLGLTLKEMEKPPIDIEALQQLLLSINKWRLEADLKEIPVAELPSDVEAVMELITSTRSSLRDKKLWQYADKIRDRLVKLDIALEDTAKGTVWRRKR